MTFHSWFMQHALFFISTASELATTENQAKPNHTCADILTNVCSSKISSSEKCYIPFDSWWSTTYVSSMKNTSNAGLDTISNKVLKLSPPCTVYSLTNMFNLCIQNNYFLSVLKRAKIVPIPKYNNLNTLCNFGPITSEDGCFRAGDWHLHLVVDEEEEEPAIHRKPL